MDSQDTNNNIDFVLTSLWAIGFAIALILIFTIFQKGLIASASLIGAFAILISAGIASASVMKNIAETKSNEAGKYAKEASKFHLDKCTEGLEHFYDLLKDGNNDRVKWIAAARALLTTLDLSKGIKEPHHQDFFELEKSKYRYKLNDLYRNPINGHKITPIFFTGLKEWNRPELTLSRVMEEVDSIEYIDENSIVAIFSILEYPENYLDCDLLSHPIDRYKEALKHSWTFTEPQKSAHKFIKELYKDPQ